MAQVKLTVVRGAPNLKDIAVTAGNAEAQTDTMSLNIDYTKMAKGDVLILIEELRQKIFASKWPLI